MLHFNLNQENLKLHENVCVTWQWHTIIHDLVNFTWNFFIVLEEIFQEVFISFFVGRF